MDRWEIWWCSILLESLLESIVSYFLSRPFISFTSPSHLPLLSPLLRSSPSPPTLLSNSHPTLLSLFPFSSPLFPVPPFPHFPFGCSFNLAINHLLSSPLAQPSIRKDIPDPAIEYKFQTHSAPHFQMYAWMGRYGIFNTIFLFFNVIFETRIFPLNQNENSRTKKRVYRFGRGTFQDSQSLIVADKIQIDWSWLR